MKKPVKKAIIFLGIFLSTQIPAMQFPPRQPIALTEADKKLLLSLGYKNQTFISIAQNGLTAQDILFLESLRQTAKQQIIVSNSQ